MSVIKKNSQSTNKFTKSTTNNKDNNIKFENYQKEELNINNNIFGDLSKEFSNLYKNTEMNDTDKTNNHSNVQRVKLNKQHNKKPNDIFILKKDADIKTANNDTKKESKKSTMNINENEIMNLLTVINIVKSLK